MTNAKAPFANIPIIIDNTVDWIGKTIAHMRANGHQRIETSKESAEEWGEQVNAAFNATVLPQGAKDTRSWYVGANVQGKKAIPLFYFGGVAPYFARCEKEITDGFPGFTFSSPIQAA